jgi:argininosuccinate synthase
MKLIQDMDDIESAILKRHFRNVLVLSNGGVDSIYLVRQLSRLDCRVTIFSVDLGGGLKRERLHQIADYFDVGFKLVEAKAAFVQDAVLPSLRACALVSRNHPVGASLSRPIIANPAHQAQAQLQNCLQSLRYPGYVGAPVGGEDLSFAQRKMQMGAIGLLQDETCISEKSSLWCRKTEFWADGEGQDFFARESLFRWSTRFNTVDRNQLTLTFSAGVPTHLDGVRMDLVPLIERLNHLVGASMVGRYSLKDYRVRGGRVLELREAPAAIALIRSLHFLMYRCKQREQWLQRKTIAQSWLEEVEAGRWFGVFKQSLGAFLETVARDVSGTVHLSFDNGCLRFRLSQQKPLSLVY